LIHPLIMADHHPYNLRHGNRLLNHLFSDEDNDVNDSIMTVTANTTTTSSSMLFENSTTTSSMLLLVEHTLPPESSPAPWSTRKTILLAEAIVVTAIVLPLLFCFLYQRASKSGHLPSRSASSRARLHGVSNTNATAEVARTSDRALRNIILQQQQQEYEPQQHDEDHSQPPRSLIQRLTSILLYPFHAIDAGVHSWSTTNADITFLRNVMDRLEEEREAQLEDVEERGERLKLAFSEGDSVWEIAEEHFVPPPTLYALSNSSPDMIKKYIGGVHNDNITAATSANKDEQVEKNAQERELGEEEKKKLSEEEVKRVDDDNHDDAMNNTATDEAVDAIATNSYYDNEVEKNDKNKEDTIDGENINIVDEESEQNHQSSSLMMNETNDNEQATRSVSPLMIDEDGEFLGELTLSSPQRSSSPLDTAASEAPAFLYLPNRKSRSRANTNETATSSTVNYLTSSLASSSNHSQRSVLDSIPSSSSHTNYSTQQIIDNPADANNNAAITTSFDNDEEEELKSVPNNCAICLSEYVSGDTIVTSCDPMCSHAFHQECIIEWLVKMQVGAPCPCCRRTFVELSPPAAPAIPVATPVANGGTVEGAGGDNNTTNDVRRATTSMEEQERRREELRRTIQLGIRRGRAFDFSVISLR